MAGKYKVLGEHKSPIKDSKKLTLTWSLIWRDEHLQPTYQAPTVCHQLREQRHRRQHGGEDRKEHRGATATWRKVPQKE